MSVEGGDCSQLAQLTQLTHPLPLSHPSTASCSWLWALPAWALSSATSLDPSSAASLQGEWVGGCWHGVCVVCAEAGCVVCA